MRNQSQFKVEALGLNLRSEPRVRSGNVVTVLPHGQPVTKLETAQNKKWWKISTFFHQQNLEGFVAHRYLTAGLETCLRGK